MSQSMKRFLSCVLATLKRWGPAVPALGMLGGICWSAWNGVGFLANMSRETTAIRVKMDNLDKSIEKVVDRVHLLERRVDVHESVLNRKS